jgi:hypothetical protein
VNQYNIKTIFGKKKIPSGVQLWEINHIEAHTGHTIPSTSNANVAEIMLE